MIMFKNTAKAVIEALAVGDALGMPTEFMTRNEIKSVYGMVDKFLDPSVSWIHSNLEYASVTDDTEQNLYLIDAYCHDKTITVQNTAEHLLRWVRETHADEKKYIGPSSLKALKDIEGGGDPFQAGKSGTTCGGVMRTPAAVLCSRISDEHSLMQSVLNCCIPTHNTSIAIEAAMSYAFAIREALLGKSLDEVINAAMVGGEKGKKMACPEVCAPSIAARIKYLKELSNDLKDIDAYLDFIYDVFGAGIESADVCAAVLGIFLYAKRDVWLAVKMGASIGGDTDTIAALSGALCAAYSGSHNIPGNLVKEVIGVNKLDIDGTADRVNNLQEALK